MTRHRNGLFEISWHIEREILPSLKVVLLDFPDMISELAKLLLRWFLIITVILLMLIIFLRELFIQVEELVVLDLTLSKLSILAFFVKSRQ